MMASALISVSRLLTDAAIPIWAGWTGVGPVLFVLYRLVIAAFVYTLPFRILRDEKSVSGYLAAAGLAFVTTLPLSGIAFGIGCAIRWCSH
ncbi:MAG: hypothetical protein K2Z80_19810 [Xanthobacteraceae bacterium]|nr:hypothetical protein [Xanthobacteraceae bacterium]